MGAGGGAEAVADAGDGGVAGAGGGADEQPVVGARPAGEQPAAVGGPFEVGEAARAAEDGLALRCGPRSRRRCGRRARAGCPSARRRRRAAWCRPGGGSRRACRSRSRGWCSCGGRRSAAGRPSADHSRSRTGPPPNVHSTFAVSASSTVTVPSVAAQASVRAALGRQAGATRGHPVARLHVVLAVAVDDPERAAGAVGDVEAVRRRPPRQAHRARAGAAASGRRAVSGSTRGERAAARGRDVEPARRPRRVLPTRRAACACRCARRPTGRCPRSRAAVRPRAARGR